MTEVTAVAIDVGTRLRSLRGLQVLLDSDLAAIYGVSTKAFHLAGSDSIPAKCAEADQGEGSFQQGRSGRTRRRR